MRRRMDGIGRGGGVVVRRDAALWSALLGD